jgi:TolB-like protein/class 3 adenylate cyclase
MQEIRRLAAILVADIVGFSRLTHANEDEMLARLRSLRRDVIDPTIATHRGRVVKRTGDGALVEFRSVVQATRCATQIQTIMAERNADEPSDHRIEFRIGIHLGDVVEEDDGDLMGDGVNVAARLEGLAQAGEICISDDAYRQVRTRLDMPVTDMGEQMLKSIAEPMKVYALHIGTPNGSAGAEPGLSAVTASPDSPSIAVLPFTNMSGDPEQDYFADGMAEDIITALSKFEQLFVIARNSSFVYKGRAVDILQVGRELGVRYVLEGSVRKAGDRVRITGQLINAASGSHLWADRYDGRLENVFDLQDQITASVVGAIEPTVRKAEIERARRKRPEHMGAYDLFLHALPHIYAIRPESNLKALGFLMKAIDLDPDYAPALGHASWCLVQRITRPWDDFSDDDLNLAITFARRVLAVGSDDAQAVVLGGFTLVMLRADYLAGLDAVRRAIALNPGSGFVNSMAGCALVFGDDAKAGLILLERAMALGPQDPSFFSYLLVAAAGHLFSDHFDIALELAERSLALNATVDSTYWVLISIYTALGRPEDAKRTARQLLDAYPNTTASGYSRVLPIRNKMSLEMVINSCREAGIPD